MTLWAALFIKGPKKCSLSVTVLYAIIFEMPIMICGLSLMRAEGNINWDEHIFDVLFQIWYIVNVMLQIIIGCAENFTKKVEYLAVILITPLSYLLICLPYAFVIIPIAGWGFFGGFSDYLEESHSIVHGTFNSTHTHSMFDFLVFSGFLGQWIWMVLVIIISLSLSLFLMCGPLSLCLYCCINWY